MLSKLKLTLLVISAAILTVGLVGCGEQAATAEADAPPPETSATPNESGAPSGEPTKGGATFPSDDGIIGR
jgi:ABC-type phosphate transport system substrate-binding protein